MAGTKGPLVGKGPISAAKANGGGRLSAAAFLPNQ